VVLFAEIYDRSTPTPHDVEVKVVVVPDRGTIPVFTKNETRAMEASATTRSHGYKAEIAMNELAPGDYILRLEASTRDGKHVAAREVPFSVRPTTTGT
jgi:hypothetical protein